jgi:diguanylate cyclase (GGDEF)-like protein/PAS domain S-box-containing protein
MRLAGGIGSSEAKDSTQMRQFSTVIGLAISSVAAISLVRRYANTPDIPDAVDSMVQALPNPVYFKWTDGRYGAVNRAWESFFGLPRDAVIGKTARDLAPAERTMLATLEASDQTTPATSAAEVYAVVVALPDGSRRDVIVSESSCVRQDGSVMGVLGSITDVTDQKRTERRMMMGHAVTRVLADAESVDRVIPTIIETMCKTMGWHYGAMYWYYRNEGRLRCEEMWGVDTAAIREFMAAAGRRSVRADEPGDGIVRRAFRLGKPVWINDVATDETLRRKSLVVKAGLHGALAFPIRDGTDVLGILEFFHTEVLQPDATLLEIADSIGSQIGQFIVRRRAEAEKYMAMHDALTGLPSRLLFMERLEHALIQAQRHGHRLAVMFIDLDRFKLINDNLGHEAGDMMLKEVARRLKLRLRQGDTVARLGGDEFVMLLEEITTPQDTLLVAQKLVGELAAPFFLAEQQVTVTASIGVSTFPEGSNDSATLLRQADAAMYDAKANGRNLCQLYSEQSQALVS